MTQALPPIFTPPPHPPQTPPTPTPTPERAAIPAIQRTTNTVVAASGLGSGSADASSTLRRSVRIPDAVSQTPDRDALRLIRRKIGV